ncbi:MAG: hypothetical protein J6B21_05970 [Oscillospiraceae bacterium]|nr:hypothetical protein [Oscillospiraceae bacterium]
MTLTEKLAYIKGLAEGLGVDETTKEGKVLLALVDLMDDVTTAVSELESDMDQAYEELDAIDEDLTDIEDFLWEDEDEDECDCCDCDCDDDDECDCCDCEDDDELFDGGIYEITCPKCGEIVCMDEDMLFSPDCGCPNCGTSFEIDFDGVECCDDEDCCCHDHDHDEE